MMAKNKTAAKKGPASGQPEYSWIAESLRPLAEPVEKLRLDPQNARTHDEDNLASIAASLTEFGQRKPVVVNRRNSEIVAGNGTFLAATRALEWTHVAVVWVDDDAAAQRGYSIADNRTAELAGWDDAILQAQLAAVEDETPDLFAALLLDQLRAEDEEDEEEESGGGEQSVPESWQVVVDCEGEDDQRKMFEQLQDDGRKCRLLTM